MLGKITKHQIHHRFNTAKNFLGHAYKNTKNFLNNVYWSVCLPHFVYFKHSRPVDSS